MNKCVILKRIKYILGFVIRNVRRINTKKAIFISTVFQKIQCFHLLTQLHPLDVIENSFQMKKQLEDFIDAFKKRIDVELNYSKSLISVSKSLDKYIKPGT
jgi:hypothetical protein